MAVLSLESDELNWTSGFVFHLNSHQSRTTTLQLYSQITLRLRELKSLSPSQINHQRARVWNMWDMCGTCVEHVEHVLSLITNLWSVWILHTARWWRTVCVGGPCQTSGWRRPGPRGSPSSRLRSGRVWTAAPELGTGPDRSEREATHQDLCTERDFTSFQNICRTHV